jgi:hypothetical protein
MFQICHDKIFNNNRTSWDALGGVPHHRLCWQKGTGKAALPQAGCVWEPFGGFTFLSHSPGIHQESDLRGLGFLKVVRTEMWAPGQPNQCLFFALGCHLSGSGHVTLKPGNISIVIEKLL